jgi:Type IV secretion system proteins
VRKSVVIAGALACSLLAPAAKADLPVIDVSQLLKWVQQAQQMVKEIDQLIATVHALENVPQNLTSMVNGLNNLAVQNPLGAIEQNLQVMLTGQGTGNCTNAQNQLTTNQYAPAAGTDFTAQWLNQNANRNAGLQACTQQMVAATQARLNQMPQLLQQLQGATDVTSVTAIVGRIIQEIATINAQQQQAMLVGQSALTQSAMAQAQILQKQRRDAMEVYTNTSPGAVPGAIPTVTPAPIPFADAAN